MATPRPRLQAIRLTDAAAERIKYVMANAAQPIVGVRVGVKNGGCAGMAYTMEYAEQVEAADEVVEDKGVRVLIDPKAVLFLIGTEMDYKTEKLSAQFVFNNPNQTSACGCGESVQLKPAAEAHSAPDGRAYPWFPTIRANTSAGKAGTASRTMSSARSRTTSWRPARRCCRARARRSRLRTAEQGLDVLSIDFSPSAQEKARALAKQRGATLTIAQADVHTWDYPAAAFDVVVEIFTQFSSPAERAKKWAGMRN